MNINLMPSRSFTSLAISATCERRLPSTAGRLIDVLLLGFYCFVIRGFTLLNITPGEKSVVILVPSLCKKEFVGLGWAITTLGHTSSFFLRRFCVFDPKNKTHHSLWIVTRL